MEEFQLIDTFVIYNTDDGGIHGPIGGGDPIGPVDWVRGDTTVKVYVNKYYPYNIQTTMTPYASLANLASETTSRFAAENDVIWSMCDDTTLVEILASNSYPFAVLGDVTTSSPACGYNGGGGEIGRASCRERVLRLV